MMDFTSPEAIARKLRDSEWENKRLETALRFYADEKRYAGPNQRFDKPDEYQPADVPYLFDVTRDGGAIARKALAS